MTTALFARVTQAAVLAARLGEPAPRVTEAVLLVAYAPPQAKKALVAEAVFLVAYSGGVNAVLNATSGLLLTAYRTGVPSQSRKRTWVFTLDGHTFYVLDLGQEGTWAYDVVTKQWSRFYTAGYDGQWNMAQGCMWGTRAVACDLLRDTVWELDPNATDDDAWRGIDHVVTGALMTRSRSTISCSTVRISGSMGYVGDSGAELNFRFSDDAGNTWSDYFTVPLEADYSQEIAFNGMGSFSAPGRIFELYDIGGLLRIDGLDAGVNNFDDDAAQGGQ